MKYSGLVPIRSNNEVYTPFSGIRKRVQHKRAQSEIPPAHTTVMGIQCDSRELLESYTGKLSANGQNFKNLSETQVSSPFTNPMLSKICKIEPQVFEMETLESENKESGFWRRKVEFAKIGDWNDTYVLRAKNHSNPRPNQRSLGSAKGQMKKVCKIIEFSPNILNGTTKKGSGFGVWQFNSGEKGVFNARGAFRLQKRINLLNAKY